MSVHFSGESWSAGQVWRKGAQCDIASFRYNWPQDQDSPLIHFQSSHMPQGMYGASLNFFIFFTIQDRTIDDMTGYRPGNWYLILDYNIRNYPLHHTHNDSGAIFHANKRDESYIRPHSFIHSVICLTTGPKPPPKRCLHIVRSRAPFFKSEYPFLSLRSSSSFLRLLPRLFATSISPFIFPSIPCFRRQFLRRMWSIQLAFRLLISCRIYIW